MATHQQPMLMDDESQPQEPMLEDNKELDQAVQQYTSSTQTSTFLRLSAELRNMIYAEVLEHDESLWVTASRRNRLSDGTPAPHAAPPALLQVCRATRTEASAMFYASNTFSITLIREENVTRAKRWAALIGEAGVKHVKRFRVHGHISWNHSYFSAATRIEISRLEDRSVLVEDCLGHDLSARVPGPAGEVRKCLLPSAPDRESLMEQADLELLIETFASKLYFREDAVERSDDDEGSERE